MSELGGKEGAREGFSVGTNVSLKVGGTVVVFKRDGDAVTSLAVGGEVGFFVGSNVCAVGAEDGVVVDAAVSSVDNNAVHTFPPPFPATNFLPSPEEAMQCQFLAPAAV